MGSLARLVAPVAAVAFVLLGPVPGSAQITVTGRTLFEHQVSPGATYSDTMTIRNASSEVQVVRLSQTDYRFEAGASSQFPAAGAEARSNARWITLSQNEVSVPPHGEVGVSYTVVVPRDAQPALEGSYWSVVLIEGEPPPPPPSAAPGTINLLTRIRYAVQIVTHLGTTGEPRVTFGGFAVEDRNLLLDVAHVGTRACRPSLRLELYRDDGVLVNAQTVQRGLLYPSTSVRQAFALPELAHGSYTVLVLADLGTNAVHGAKYSLQIPGGSQ